MRLKRHIGGMPHLDMTTSKWDASMGTLASQVVDVSHYVRSYLAATGVMTPPETSSSQQTLKHRVEQRSIGVALDSKLCFWKLNVDDACVVLRGVWRRR